MVNHNQLKDERIENKLLVHHLICNPVAKTRKIIVPQKAFHTAREKIGSKTSSCCEVLDPEDSREFDMNPGWHID
jgi:hypothetical protein